MTYYGRFYRSALYPFLRRVNTYLMRWARKKYKRLRWFKRFTAWWTGLVDREPGLFRHWAWQRQFCGEGEKSGVTGDCHAPFRGSPGVRFPRATRPCLLSVRLASEFSLWFCHVVALCGPAVEGAGWPSGTGFAGFRRTGRAGGRRADVPDSAPTIISGRGGRTSKARIASFASAFSRRRDMRKPGETRSSTVSTMLRPTVSRMRRPLPRRSSVTSPRPSARAPEDGTGRLAVDLDHARPFSMARRAIERGEQFGPAGAHDAGEADDLAGADDEAHVLRRLPAGPRGPGAKAGVIQPQHRLAERGRALGIELVERAPNEEAHELRLRRVGGLHARDLPVAHDGDAIGDARHFFEPVRDIDDADAARGDLAHDDEKPLHFGGGERRRRLVHDEDLRCVGQRLGDGDDLPAPDPKLAHGLVDADVLADDAEPLDRFCAHRRAVEHPAACKLAPEEQIGGDVEARHEVELLEIVATPAAWAARGSSKRTGWPSSSISPSSA